MLKKTIKMEVTVDIEVSHRKHFKSAIAQAKRDAISVKTGSGNFRNIPRRAKVITDNPKQTFEYDYLRELGFDDVSTGGGCYGWYLKKNGYTYYITVREKLTLPTSSSDKVDIGVYDSDFERQFMTYSMDEFITKKLMSRIDMLERKMKTKKVQKMIEDSPNGIIYLP